MLFSHHNGEKTLVLLCFRLKIMLFEYVLLCSCSHMCKKHYKTNQKSCFLHIGSPNPLFYCCKLLAMLISLLIVFKPFVLTRFEKGPSRSAAGWRPISLHALCVFLCIPLFDVNWEPLEVPSVREKHHLPSKIPGYDCITWNAYRRFGRDFLNKFG